MYSRTDYMEGRCTHREYYAQFVTEELRLIVAAGIGLDKIKKSVDPALNDIKLTIWDGLTTDIPQEVKLRVRAAGDFNSLGVGVCILKEAAKQLKEQTP